MVYGGHLVRNSSLRQGGSLRRSGTLLLDNTSSLQSVIVSHTASQGAAPMAEWSTAGISSGTLHCGKAAPSGDQALCCLITPPVFSQSLCHILPAKGLPRWLSGLRQASRPELFTAARRLPQEISHSAA